MLFDMFIIFGACTGCIIELLALFLVLFAIKCKEYLFERFVCFFQACSDEEDGLLGFDFHTDGHGQKYKSAIQVFMKNVHSCSTIFPHYFRITRNHRGFIVGT